MHIRKLFYNVFPSFFLYFLLRSLMLHLSHFSRAKWHHHPPFVHAHTPPRHLCVQRPVSLALGAVGKHESERESASRLSGALRFSPAALLSIKRPYDNIMLIFPRHRVTCALHSHESTYRLCSLTTLPNVGAQQGRK